MTELIRRNEYFRDVRVVIVQPERFLGNIEPREPRHVDYILPVHILQRLEEVRRLHSKTKKVSLGYQGGK